MVAQKAQRLTIGARQGMIEKAIPEPGVWVSRSLVMPQNQQSAPKDDQIKRMVKISNSQSYPGIMPNGSVKMMTSKQLLKTPAAKKVAKQVRTTKH
jgi:hypothetical protein